MFASGDDATYAGQPLTGVEQEHFATTGDVVDDLAGIEWPDTVDGCAVAVERLFLPAGSESQLPADPAAAVAEAARLVMPGGKLLIVDFAPHELERLRDEHQHRRLGFADEEIGRWLGDAGLKPSATIALPPDTAGLTVTIWTAERPAIANRSVA